MEHAWIVVATQGSSVKPSTDTHGRVSWELPEPFAIYNQGDASLKLWLTQRTVLCSRFSSKDQSLEIRGMWGRRGGSEGVEFKPTACQPVRFSGQLSASEDVSSCGNRSVFAFLFFALV